MIYFTSDTHFNHANVIKHCDRPFAGLEQMHEALIGNWNEAVRPNDDIYILGDFMFAKNRSEVAGMLEKLNGRKYLIKGNHDKRSYCEGLFEWVKDYQVLKYNGLKFVMFHFPILVWDGYYKDNRIHLYGHVHNTGLRGFDEYPEMKALEGKRAYNVGVDVNDFKPVGIEEIIRRFIADMEAEPAEAVIPDRL